MIGAAIHIVPVLRDNYTYIAAAPDGSTIIDPGESSPVERLVEDLGLTPRRILLTHHHDDHTGGAAALKRRYGIPVLAPAGEMERIPEADIPVSPGLVPGTGSLSVHALPTPGHTTGHVAYHIPGLKALFSGDALFSLGCGRIFEGDAAQMWQSLRLLAALPPDTLLYCGHEYTLANGRFALAVDPGNDMLKRRMEEAEARGAMKLPTVPVALETEAATNPFLRAPDAGSFARLRAMKDAF